MRILQPHGWARPRGYSNGIEAEGKLVFVAGQIGWNAEGKFEAKTFGDQFRQTLINTLAVLREGGAGPEHITRMTWFITNRDEYADSLAQLGAAWKELIGPNYPTMSVIIVAGLIEPEAKIEIETTAVIPNHEPRRHP